MLRVVKQEGERMKIQRGDMYYDKNARRDYASSKGHFVVEMFDLFSYFDNGTYEWFKGNLVFSSRPVKR